MTNGNDQMLNEAFSTNKFQFSDTVSLVHKILEAAQIRHLSYLSLSFTLYFFSHIDELHAQRIDCDEVTTRGASESRYQYRKDADRCEGIFFENKSLLLNKNSLFHVRSIVYGSIHYQTDVTSRLYIKPDPNDFNVKGNIEILGRSLNPDIKYELRTSIDSGNIFSWRTDAVLEPENIQPQDLGVIASVNANQVAEAISTGTEQQLYIPVVFYTDNISEKKEELQVTIVSQSRLRRVEIYDGCEKDNPIKVVSKGNIQPGEHITFKIESESCNDPTVYISIPALDMITEDSQSFVILR